MKKPITRSYKAYYNNLVYRLTEQQPGYFWGDGVYLSIDGMAVQILVHIDSSRGKKETNLYLRWKGTEFNKTYPGQTFNERGLRMICARFIRQITL